MIMGRDGADGRDRVDELGLGSGDAIITVRDLQVEYKTALGTVNALNGVSFDVSRGTVLGVVGESGSGKSVTARAIMQILERAGPHHRRLDPLPPPDWRPRESARRGRDSSRPLSASGEVDITGLKPTSDTMRAIRGSEIAMIFQEPMSSLNPVYTVGVADPGGDPAPPDPGQEAVLGPGRGHAAPGRDAEPGADRELLPARAVRRHAATGHDRHGPVLPPRAAHRRRADHGAGRDDRGPDPGPDASGSRKRSACRSCSSPTAWASSPSCATRSS